MKDWLTISVIVLLLILFVVIVLVFVIMAQTRSTIKSRDRDIIDNVNIVDAIRQRKLDAINARRPSRSPGGLSVSPGGPLSGSSGDGLLSGPSGDGLLNNTLSDGLLGDRMVPPTPDREQVLPPILKVSTQTSVQTSTQNTQIQTQRSSNMMNIQLGSSNVQMGSNVRALDVDDSSIPVSLPVQAIQGVDVGNMLDDSLFYTDDYPDVTAVDISLSNIPINLNRFSLTSNTVSGSTRGNNQRSNLGGNQRNNGRNGEPLGMDIGQYEDVQYDQYQEEEDDIHQVIITPTSIPVSPLSVVSPSPATSPVPTSVTVLESPVQQTVENAPSFVGIVSSGSPGSLGTSGTPVFPQEVEAQDIGTQDIEPIGVPAETTSSEFVVENILGTKSITKPEDIFNQILRNGMPPVGGAVNSSQPTQIPIEHQVPSPVPIQPQIPVHVQPQVSAPVSVQPQIPVQVHVQPQVPVQVPVQPQIPVQVPVQAQSPVQVDTQGRETQPIRRVVDNTASSFFFTGQNMGQAPAKIKIPTIRNDDTDSDDRFSINSNSTTQDDFSEDEQPEYNDKKFQIRGEVLSGEYIDVCSYSNSIIYVKRDGTIIRKMKMFNTFTEFTITSDIKVEQLAQFNGYLYCSSRGYLYKLDNNSFSSSNWTWISCPWVEPTILFICSTHFGKELWIQNETRGFLYQQNGRLDPVLVQTVDITPNKTRVYGNNRDSYLELDFTKHTSVYSMTNSITNNVKTGILGYGDEQFLVHVSENIDKVRLVNWKPIYIQDSS
jgi:hypothetical protein